MPDTDLIKAQLQALHKEIRETAQEAIRNISKDTRVLIVRTLPDGDKKEFYIYHGVWTPSFGGLKMMVVDDINQCPQKSCPLSHQPAPECTCTRVLASSGKDPVHVPLHSHHYMEYVHVIQGTVTELTTGETYVPGQTIYYPANYRHEPVVNGLILICWQPPLSIKHELDVCEPEVVPESEGELPVDPDGFRAPFCSRHNHLR